MGQVIRTGDAPPAIGPYSQAIRTGDLLFVSGSLGIDPATRKLVEGGVAKQTEQAIRNLQKIVGNICEVKARKGRIIAITNEGNSEVSEMADHVICVPRTIDSLYPILTVVPLQLLAYHIAVARGCNVDQPRNLAKSVTVE